MPERAAPRSLAAVVLAAGKGRRIRSQIQKVLHPVCGRPALWHVLQNARAARPQRIAIVVDHGADQVRDAVASWRVRPEPVFVEQGQPLGTGHAVLVAEEAVSKVDDVLVLGGDFDPVTPEHVKELLRVHRRTKSAASLLTAEVDEPGGYGRVLRDGDRLVDIVEHADAPRAVRAISEVSTLVFVFRREDLFGALPLLGRDNRQREYYLNDVFPILMAKGGRVSAIRVDTGGAMGLNSRGGLAAVRRVVQDRINAAHMANAVTIVDPSATYIDVGVRIEPDTVIHPLTFLEGSTRIGAGCDIGPSTRIVDSRVDEGATVAYSVVKGSRIGRGANVGPYTHVRPGTVLAEGAKAGSFVEIKASEVGPGSKVPHLSYIGDTTIGRRTNIGAATVTVNYDGYEKQRTVIGNDVRIGSDTMLVAPVKVGDGAITGAGSVITKDVPSGALAVERSEQRIVKGYRKRKDAAVEKGRARGHGEA